MIQVALIDKMGSDLSVVNAARVSFSKVHIKMEHNDEKLIKYLAEHQHWSPFAHTSLQFHIQAPVFVARQLAKHQVGLVWNEVSRRYVSDQPSCYSPDKWRKAADDKKQGSTSQSVQSSKLITKSKHGSHYHKECTPSGTGPVACTPSAGSASSGWPPMPSKRPER